MGDRFVVSVGAGSLLEDSPTSVVVPHAWTATGVSVRGDFTGAHVMHLAVAGCVLNDLYRQAERRGLRLYGVHVTAEGGFDDETWQSTGVEYAVAVDSALLPEQVAALVAEVEQLAEIPRALRGGVPVQRVGHV